MCQSKALHKFVSSKYEYPSFFHEAYSSLVLARFLTGSTTLVFIQENKRFFQGFSVHKAQHPAFSKRPTIHGAYISTLGLMECKKYMLYVIRKR